MDLICYLSNGYPSLERSIEIAKDYVKGGCDIIEIDFPSRDPFLEGSTLLLVWQKHYKCVMIMMYI